MDTKIRRRTPFSPENKKFTDKCHRIAQDIIYPGLFKVSRERLAFMDTDLGTSEENTIYDGKMATDRIVAVTLDNMRAPIEHMIQERFRHKEYADFRDMTITEWNTESDLPSELYKLKSGIFVYGYANDNEEPTDFIEAIAADTARLIRQITENIIKYKRDINPRTKQPFISIPFYELEKKNDILFSYPARAKRPDMEQTIVHFPTFPIDDHPTWPRDTYEQWLRQGTGTKDQQARYREAIAWYEKH